MKAKMTFIVLINWVFAFQTYSQTLELAANYTTSSAIFYKNCLGINIGFIYQLKNQYLFTELETSQKNNSYSEIEPSIASSDLYFIEKVTGKILINKFKLGIAQKVMNSDKVCISLGGYASLNYFKIDTNIEFLGFSTTREGTIFFDTEDEFLKNKFGFGGLIDLDIKQFLFENMSLFSRIEVAHTKFKPDVRGLSFTTFDFNYIGFALGLRINLKK
jgi:hypothetical protein